MKAELLIFSRDTTRLGNNDLTTKTRLENARLHGAVDCAIEFPTVSRKINLEKVRASLSILCPHCGYEIPPEEIRRVDFHNVVCPKCRLEFMPGSQYRM
jgi:predicted RNA-binding Zn-ribbon protein involved in translation (DUF1610 family)